MQTQSKEGATHFVINSKKWKFKMIEPDVGMSLFTCNIRIRYYYDKNQISKLDFIDISDIFEIERDDNIGPYLGRGLVFARQAISKYIRINFTKSMKQGAVISYDGLNVFGWSDSS